MGTSDRSAIQDGRVALKPLAGAALLGCLLILGLQTRQLLEERRENKSLHAAAVGLEQLRQENNELQKLRATAQNAERQAREQDELSKLRGEVSQLRAAAQELTALRAESQRLQAERAAAAARANVPVEEDPFAEAHDRAMRINCISNIKQIGLAARIWANDHRVAGQPEMMPVDFLTMRNELNSPRILTCPADAARKAATSWQEFDGSSVSYEMLSPGAPEDDPAIVYVRCPIHHNVGLTDGSAQQLSVTAHRVEKVDGKYKIVRASQAAQP
jgi:hypothetical protein